MFDLRYGRRLALYRAALAGVLLIAGPSWAQENQPVRKPLSNTDFFAMYHNALSSRADDLLTVAAQRFERNSTNSSVLVPVIPQAADTGVPGKGAARELAIQRVQALRPELEAILREEGVPPQMAAVVLVESGGRARALSPKGARGLWQFMPDTARRYGLVVTATNDERLDLRLSTRAAARYLRDLYTQFGDWALALAAYNAGEDAVERAINLASTRDFHSIARAGMLPLETRNYVPAVLNAMDMIGALGKGRLTAGAGQRVFGTVAYALHEAEN